MMAIICFDLIPEAIEMAGLGNTIIGTLAGVTLMLFCDNIVKRKHNEKNSNSLLNTGIIVGIGLALHNFPEGLAIGSGFGASIKLRVFASYCNFAS